MKKLNAELHEVDIDNNRARELAIEQINKLLADADNISALIVVSQTKDGHEDGAMIGDPVDLYSMGQRIAEITKDAALQVAGLEEGDFQSKPEAPAQHLH